MELLNRFIKNIEGLKLADKQHKLLLAVSGGVDSMVLADLCLKAGYSFAIAHCNFGLRGNDSDLDEQLVIDWAAKNNIVCYNTRFDTKQACEDMGKGTQETARILRYEWFDKLMNEHRFHRLVTAHHANDNAETLLMHLFKGTGISGLHGIPIRNGYKIRPLLFARKEEIREYATANKIAFREDVSNDTDDYLRNAVRLHVIPAAEKWFPNIIDNVSNSIQRFAEAEQIYRGAIEKQKKQLKEHRGNDIYIPVLKLQKAEPLYTICYELFNEYGFTSAQIPHIVQLLSSESGRYISSATHRIIRDRNFLIVTLLPESGQADMMHVDAVPCTLHAGNREMYFDLLTKPADVNTGNDIALIDAAKVNFPLTIRKWRTGDYFYPLGMGMKKKKLSKFFIDNKIPVHEKEHVWVVESNKRIVWVAGMRLDERFKITANTIDVLRIQLSAV